MLEINLLRENDYRSQLWKNGRGETKEIAVDDADPYTWRVSWAKLNESGPFSVFPGYDRVLRIARGGPVKISVDGRPGRPLHPLDGLQFSGDAQTEADVAAPAEDFNVFARRGTASAKAYPARLSQAEDYEFPVAATEHFLFCIEGQLKVRDPNAGGSYELKAGDTLRITRRTKKEFLNLKARGHSASSVCFWALVYADATR